MKKITFLTDSWNGMGGSYKVKVTGDKNKENWGKIDDTTVVDYEARAIEVDAKEDGYKIEYKKIEV